MTANTAARLKAQREAREAEAEEPRCLAPIPTFPIDVLPASAQGLGRVRRCPARANGRRRAGGGGYGDRW